MKEPTIEFQNPTVVNALGELWEAVGELWQALTALKEALGVVARQQQQQWPWEYTTAM